MKIALFIAALAVVALSDSYGFDVAYNFPQSAWNCLHDEHGMSFAIIRCYQSVGRVDPECAASVQKAWNSGLSYVDLYVFPCPRCGNAAKQIVQLHDYVTTNNVKFGMVWLDIEGAEDYWMDVASNRAFYEELAAKTNELFGNGKWGVYTNQNGWESIMGAWTPSLSCPLWHAYWDNTPSLSGFTPFDGWNTRAIKQYQGTTYLCNMGIDLNFY